ncbi:hypothetical protein NEUTE2DRAFT_153949 [Neurospora tetrasperma FGSC 2509]|nr:hypothetical protein NEUTE2DRAFT_153949 [Neurospora tetrasperma FGSC 2509]
MSEEESNEGRFESEESAEARATGARMASQAKELVNAPPIRILSNNSLGLSQDRFMTLDRRTEANIRRSYERAKTENGSGADGLQVGRMTGGGTEDTFRHAAEV